jgi:hypothetical protein
LDRRARRIPEVQEERRQDCQAKLHSHLEEIIHEHPDDIEAKAFLVVRLYQFKNDLPIASHQAVDAILDQVFALNPMHPAHHYRIHLWDRENPSARWSPLHEEDSRALASLICGICPDISILV